MMLSCVEDVNLEIEQVIYENARMQLEKPQDATGALHEVANVEEMSKLAK